MVKKRKGAIIRKVKDISISSALTLVLLGGSALLQSCDDSEEGTTEETTTEMVNEEVFTKSVQTHITEVSPRVFRITDEKVVEEEGKSSAIINYLSGKVDTLTIEQAREIVEKQHQTDSLRVLASAQGIDSTKNAVDTTKKQSGAATKAYQNTRTSTSSSYSSTNSTPVDQNYQQHNNYGTSQYNSSSHFDNSLGTMLMVGGMGYMMGSTVNNYRTRYLEDADRRSSSSGRGGGGGYSSGTSRFYSNPATHAKTQSTHTNLKSSRTTVSRPASSRSGFFSRSGSSSSGSSSSSKSSSGSSFSRSGSS